MKGDIGAQRILIESIKDSLILDVSKLESSKEICDKIGGTILEIRRSNV